MYKNIWIHKLLTADCKYEGVNLTPSMKIETGASNIKDMIVIIENKVMLSNDSCTQYNSNFICEKQVELMKGEEQFCFWVFRKSYQLKEFITNYKYKY